MSHSRSGRQIYALLDFLVLLWCFHQSNAFQEGEQYEQLTRQRIVEQDWDEWDSPEGEGGPWWERERGVMMCCPCYTDDEWGMVIISYHPQCSVFWFPFIFASARVLTYSEPNSGALGSEPRPAFSGGPELGCLVRVRMSFHTTPNQPDYLTKRSRVRLKRTKQLRCESTLRWYLVSGDLQQCVVTSVENYSAVSLNTHMNFEVDFKQNTDKISIVWFYNFLKIIFFCAVTSKITCI